MQDILLLKCDPPPLPIFRFDEITLLYMEPVHTLSYVNIPQAPWTYSDKKSSLVEKRNHVLRDQVRLYQFDYYINFLYSNFFLSKKIIWLPGLKCRGQVLQARHVVQYVC